MAPLKVSLSFIAVLISVLGEVCVDGFVAPCGRPTAPSQINGVVRTKTALSNRVEARPQQRMHEVWRRQTSMSAASRGEVSSAGLDQDQPPAEPSSRLSRISKRVRKIIRKAIMGYLPEEEMSYKQSTAKAAADAAALRGEAQVADQRLRGDASKAKAAAADVVAQDVDEDEDDLLSSDFVQLNIGDQSPMEAEEMMASLRRRMENGMSPDTEAEKSEKQRRSKQEQRSEKFSRPASFDGDTAVAELPPSKEGTRQPREEDATGSQPTPKLASAEDIERLNRMFGSMGGEPLR